ncbi:3-dehydroquinate synthase [Aerococcus sp. HMSC10H05]|uniref:3-dehydroquinate synthase n=1 Tax=Aerococcus sp. HMSC10H05 TaxID=1581084 RepID=UPI0008A15C93|nr:3-dehydroquinate synthase [Aerococcus sp. HMSC10H05]OFU52349.1 3-dehydroquinate synthase [Aerococcus sp. HMSC10H05]
MKLEKVNVAVAKPYDVIIDNDLIKNAGHHLEDFIQQRKVMIITDENVASFGYLGSLQEAISPITKAVHTITLPAGEEQKSSANYIYLQEQLATLNYSRTDVLIALGGGVIGDLVGFTAATYLRGIPYIQMPTTLLSAIDSSVGGKTAIDLPQGKNLVGAFYQPARVLCDLTTFHTLSQSIFEDGCAELIKYGMILDDELLNDLMTRDQPLTALSDDLANIVKRCVEIKRNVVLEDEHDLGLRQLLNFGHTIGHAIEQVSHYKVSHGRGVATGMILTQLMAEKEGLTDLILAERFNQLLNQYHLLDQVYLAKAYTFADLLDAMTNDKKRRGGEITEIFPESFGKCELKTITFDQYANWLEKIFTDLKTDQLPITIIEAEA